MTVQTQAQTAQVAQAAQDQDHRQAFFWMMLEAGYMGTAQVIHPIHGVVSLTIQQFQEPDLFGIAYYSRESDAPISTTIGTQLTMLAQMSELEFFSSWDIFPLEETPAI